MRRVHVHDQNSVRQSILTLLRRYVLIPFFSLLDSLILIWIVIVLLRILSRSARLYRLSTAVARGANRKSLNQRSWRCVVVVARSRRYDGGLLWRAVDRFVIYPQKTHITLRRGAYGMITLLQLLLCRRHAYVFFQFDVRQSLECRRR